MPLPGVSGKILVEFMKTLLELTERPLELRDGAVKGHHQSGLEREETVGNLFRGEASSKQFLQQMISQECPERQRDEPCHTGKPHVRARHLSHPPEI